MFLKIFLTSLFIEACLILIFAVGHTIADDKASYLKEFKKKKFRLYFSRFNLIVIAFSVIGMIWE